MTNYRDLDFLTTISKKLTPKILHEIIIKISNTKAVSLDGWENTNYQHSKGDSLLSDVYRFSIIGTETLNDGSSKKVVIPVVAKGLPENIARRKTFRSAVLSKNEQNFYQIWDHLMEFQKAKNLPRIFNQIPRCLASLADGENDFLILEDISPLGYKSIGRRYFLDLDHCKVLMRLVADFHATSYAFKVQNPDEYSQLASKLEEVYYSEKWRSWFQGLLKNVLYPIFNDALEKEVPGSIYEKKFKELEANDFYGQIIKLVEAKNKYNVINNGDLWRPNFLFKYKGDQVDSAMLVDFQLARNSPLAVDLSFFIYLCIDSEVRLQHWNELIEEYYKEFIAYSKQLGCNDESLFTLQDLHDEMLQFGKFAIMPSLEGIPMTWCNVEDFTDSDKIEGDEAVDISTVWKFKSLATKEQRMHIVNLITEQVERGFI